MAAEQTPIPVKRTVRLDAGIRTRQVYLTVFIIALAIWMALPFLTPIAWAAVLAMAEWPLYRRAVARAHGLERADRGRIYARHSALGHHAAVARRGDAGAGEPGGD